MTLEHGTVYCVSIDKKINCSQFVLNLFLVGNLHNFLETERPQFVHLEPVSATFMSQITT